MLLPQSVLDRMTNRPYSAITHACIHHTASNNQNEDISAIAQMEIATFGFVTVGYHFVVHADGKIQVGRPLGKVPAANLGMNTQSVAISLEGNFHPSDPNYIGEVPSVHALHAAATIINHWVKPKCPNLQYLIGHRDVAVIMQDSNDATACPGDLLYAKCHDLRLATGLLQDPAL